MTVILAVLLLVFACRNAAREFLLGFFPWKLSEGLPGLKPAECSRDLMHVFFSSTDNIVVNYKLMMIQFRVGLFLN